MSSYALKFRPLPGYRSILEGVYMANEERSLLSCLGEDDAIRIVAYDHVKKVFSELGCWFVPSKAVRCHTWSPDGRLIFVACQSQVLVYRWNEGIELATSYTLYYSATDISCRCEIDGENYRLGLSGPHGSELYSVRVEQGKIVLVGEPMKLHRDSYVHWLRWSGTGRFLMMATLDGYLSVWEIGHDGPMNCWYDRLGDFDRITSMTMDPEETRLLLCGLDSRIIIYQKSIDANQWSVSETFGLTEDFFFTCSAACFGILYNNGMFFIRGTHIEQREGSSVRKISEEDIGNLSSEVKGIGILGTNLFLIDRDGNLNIIPLDDSSARRDFVNSTGIRSAIMIYQAKDGRNVRFDIRHQYIRMCEEKDIEGLKELFKLKLPFYIDKTVAQQIKDESTLRWEMPDWLFFYYEGCFYACKASVPNAKWACFASENEWIAYDSIHVDSMTIRLLLLDQQYRCSVWEYEACENRWKGIDHKNWNPLSTKPTSIRSQPEFSMII
jgi:hypothetical protein